MADRVQVMTQLNAVKDIECIALYLSMLLPDPDDEIHGRSQTGNVNAYDKSLYLYSSLQWLYKEASLVRDETACDVDDCCRIRTTMTSPVGQSRVVIRPG